MNIAVLGSGTVGVMSVCHFLRYMPFSNITCIYDIQKPILGIGESTNIQLPSLLWESVKYNVFIDSKELSSTVKLGVYYKNWRKKDFISPILPISYAMHFDNFKLAEQIFKRCKKIYKNRFTILNEEVIELKQDDKKVTVFLKTNKKEYDYVIDCRGWPENYSEYEMCKALPLNRCFVNMIPKPGDWSYTYHQAHNNGWMFGIPLTHRQGWGYLFNDKITSEEEAVAEINQIFKSKLNKKDLRDFKFKAYRSKKYLDRRIIKNGNRAIFYEPLEALSGGYYDNLNRFFFDYIHKIVNEDEVNKGLDLRAKQYENFICYVYSQGSIYNSKFWKQTKKITSKHLKNNLIWKDTLNYLKNNTEKNNAENINLSWPFFSESWKILMNNFNKK